ncbi:hypothetical protein SCUCBS95973_006592 [Sporothrix curviconia]|uniref:VOC domain-containing protein n=1 Tax=Sporothrix curviconia TaxID=1260050 RepID=A0ABP0C6R3_9PEZI
MTSNMTSPRKITLLRIAHVYYTHKDTASAARFLDDFGFTKIEGHKSSGDGNRENDVNKTYYRGTGPEPFLYCLASGSADKFGGAAFVVASREDLDYAAATIPNATPVHAMNDEPGGGFRVTFLDPVDGFPFHLVYGQTPVETHGDVPSTDRPFNYVRPAPVHKFGHFGMCVTNFSSAYAFYTSRFNFAPSDLVHDAAGRDITTFLHLDLGSTLVDHHCFFFFEGPVSHVHHSSFETYDFDTQVLGHDWLRAKGYENCWGVGRHVMGSQIFDYWFDPSRFILEHYVDGDLVNNECKANRRLASPDDLHVWGPDLPATFLQ